MSGRTSGGADANITDPLWSVFRAHHEALDRRVDGQVWYAASHLSAGQREQPEWLWYGGRSALPSYGRWQGEVGQAPYVRADIALATLVALAPSAPADDILAYEGQEPAPASDPANTGPDLAELTYSIFEMVAQYALVSVDEQGTPVVAFAAGCAEALVAGQLVRAGRPLPVQQRPAPLDQEAVGRIAAAVAIADEDAQSCGVERWPDDTPIDPILPSGEMPKLCTLGDLRALTLPPAATDPAVERVRHEPLAQALAGRTCLDTDKDANGRYLLLIDFDTFEQALSAQAQVRKSTPSLRSGLPEQETTL